MEKTSSPRQKNLIHCFVAELLDTQLRGHHPDSPSSLQASEACPCFQQEQREETANSASAKGTLQHKAAETRDLDLLHGDEAMVAAVQKCLDYEDRIVAYFRSRGVEPIIEREIYLAVGDDVVIDKNGKRWEGVTGGYPDTLIYSLELLEAHVPDWKFGIVPVTPTKDNVQGFSYELGARRYILQKYGKKLNAVTVHFYAPYQGWSDEEQEEKYICTFFPEGAQARELRVRTIIAQKHSKNAKPRAKVDLCIWCARKGDCPANKAAIIPLEGKYEDLVCPDIVAPHELALPSQFAAALKFAGQVEFWAKAVKARCSDVALTEGIDVPGFKMVSRSDRKIESVKTFQEIVLKNGITPDEFIETLTPSLGAVEDLVKAKAPKGGGAAAIRQLTSDLEEAGATTKSKPYYFLKEVKAPADKVIDV